jgi:hypothetical protein
MEPSGPVQACTGIALPLPFPQIILYLGSFTAQQKSTAHPLQIPNFIHAFK